MLLGKVYQKRRALPNSQSLTQSFARFPCRMVRRWMCSGRATASVQEHQVLVETLAGGDAEHAAARVKAHIEHARDAMPAHLPSLESASCSLTAVKFLHLGPCSGGELQSYIVSLGLGEQMSLG